MRPTPTNATSLAFACCCAAIIAGCGDMSAEIVVPQKAVQTAVDAWLPVELSDYVEQEVPAEMALTGATVILKEGTDRIGMEMHLDIRLPEIKPDKIIEAVAPKEAPRPPEPPAGLPAAIPPGPPFGPPGAPEPPQPATPPTDPAEAPSPDKTLAARQVAGTVIAAVGVRYDPSDASFYCQDAVVEKIDIGDLPSDLEPVVREVCGEAMNKYFADNAVYKLDDEQSGMKVAKSALKNVTVRDGQLIVELGL